MPGRFVSLASPKAQILQGGFMDILYVIFLSVFSLVVLFLLTKLIGYRQMSEMSMFDYISGITIGSIAAEMATAPDSSFLEPLTAMIVYGLLTAFLAFITEKI